jgi:hypothetical protein
MNSERRSCSARSKLLERILIPLWGASGGPAVHPTSAVRHRGRLAPDAGSCPRSAPSAQVRGRFALHGVDSPFSLDPHPPGSGPSRPLPDPACTWTCPTVTFCWPFPRCLLSASSNVARCGRAYLPGSDFPADLRKSQAVSGLSLIAMTFTGSPAVVWYRSSYVAPRGSPNGEAAPVREDRPNGHGHYKTVTLVAGLRLRGLTAPKVYDRPLTAALFEEWVEKCLLALGSEFTGSTVGDRSDIRNLQWPSQMMNTTATKKPRAAATKLLSARSALRTSFTWK